MQPAPRDSCGEIAAQALQLAAAQIMAELRFFSEAAALLEPTPAPGGPTLAVDGQHLFYDPQGVLRLFAAQRTALTRSLLHCLLHCLLGHPFQRQDRDRRWWDLACDLAVEAILCELDLSMLAVADEAEAATCCTQWLERAGGSACETLYNCLLEHPPTPPEYERLCTLLTRDDHGLWYAAPEGRREPGGIRPGQQPGRRASTEEEPDPQPARTRQEDAGQAPPLQKRWRRLARQAAADLESFHRQRGRQAGRLLANLRPVVFEQVDYSEFLRRFGAQTEVLELSDDEFDMIYYTYGLQCYGNVPLIEPLETQARQRIREFVIAIDTSGSVQGETVQTFLQRTCNVLRQTGSFARRVKIYLLQCDSAVQDLRELHDLRELEQIVPRMDLRGFGGTDFRPVFDTVDRLLQEKKLQQLDGLLYFTDGMGQYPLRQPPYKTAFIFYREDYLSPHVPPWAIRAVLTPDNIKIMKES